ncbi:MAG: class C sortase [Clostridia bacterium]|nr:class C sortase [Clostridia bacterium]
MKAKIVLIIAGVVFAAGLLFYLLPEADNFFYEKSVDKSRKQYFQELEDNPALRIKLDDLYDYLRQYNEDLYENKQKTLCDPFSYTQPKIDLSEFGVLDNTIGYIHIEKIDITVPVFLGADLERLKDGAAHMTETSYPIGGPNTNGVIAAHRSIRRHMFRDIDKLEPGDLVQMENFRETLFYRVCEKKIIRPTDVESLLIQDGRDMITLFACHPYSKTTQRILVYCERV